MFESMAHAALMASPGESRQKQNGCADHEGREPDHEVGQHGDADFFVDRRLVERERKLPPF